MQFYYTPIFICLTSFSVTKIKEKKKPNSLILQNLKTHMVIRTLTKYMILIVNISNGQIVPQQQKNTNNDI